MKIAIIADPLDNQNAGVHIYTKSLVEELLKREDGHTYFLVRQKRDDNLKGIEQIVLPSIPIPFIYTAYRLFLLVPLVLRKKKVDVVVEPAHFGPFNLPKNIKRVTFIHDLTPIKFPEYHRWYSQTLQRIFLGRILKNTHLVLTNSKNTSRDLEEYYPCTKDKNQTILLGKEPIYHPTKNDNLVKELDLNNPYFLSVGTIEPRKNLVRLLDAFSLFMQEEHMAYDLVFAGGLGWKTEEFETALANHPYRNRIKMLGYVKKEALPVLYTHATALIYPSLYEGFGFPVLEAMSCGTAVICSNTSSLPEVGGEVAHYCNPQSTDEITEQMVKISQYTADERQLLHKKSLTQAATFSWKKHVDAFIQALEGIK